jgi:hypothetical protein
LSPATHSSFLKTNGPEPVLSDLPAGLGLRHALRHHERNDPRGFAESGQDQSARLFQLQCEGLGVDDLETVEETREDRDVFGAPTLQRGDAVLGRHRLSIVPQQPVAQGESIGELVLADLITLEHLRLDLTVLIHRKQRVVDHVAMQTRDGRWRPNWIEDL